MPRNWRITSEFEVFYCLNLKSLPENIKHDLIMQPNVPMKHLFIYFSARLRNNLRYYLRSRDCLDDFERVFYLLISDKLKSSLPAVVLNYMLSLIGNDWFDPRRIVELTNTCVSNHTSAKKPKHVNSAYVASSGSESPKMNAKNGGRFGYAFRAAKGKYFSKEMVCYNCQKKGACSQVLTTVQCCTSK